MGKSIAIRTLKSDIATLERLKSVAEFDAKNFEQQLIEKRAELRKLEGQN